MAPRKQREREKTKNPKPTSKNSSSSAETSHSRLSKYPRNSSQRYQKLQQTILNVYRNIFADRFNQELSEVVQAVKSSLYNRNFSEAFGTEEYLAAYAIRWSPSRALAYLDVLLDLKDLYHIFFGSLIRNIQPEKLRESCTGEFNTERTKLSEGKLPLGTDLGGRITCLGGGAGAEIIALAGFLHQAHTHKYTTEPELCYIDDPSVSHQLIPAKLEIHAVDVADWSIILQKLQSGITSPPEISQYASASARAANRPLINPDYFSLAFTQQDVLQLTKKQISDLFRDVALVTFMFTLNELYSTSIASTTTLLLSLTSTVPAGSLLLIIDSPSSYSSVQLSSTSAQAHEADDVYQREHKRYPMQWLLDHTLLQSASEGNDRTDGKTAVWEKLVDNESRWFRLSERLTFPVKLEDTRMQRLASYGTSLKATSGMLEYCCAGLPVLYHHFAAIS
ncbi:MAG: hypothetical protein Q9167_003898 [Letrouitia subvulpina]